MTDNDGFRGGNAHNAHKEGGGMKRSRNSRERGGAMMGTWCVIFKSHVIERERVSDCARARVS